MRSFSLLFCAVLLGALSCASVPPPAAPTVAGERGLYALDVPGMFRPVAAEGSPFDVLFSDRDDAVFLGVVVDGPALSLEALDRAVAENLQGGTYDRARVVEVTDTSLGGLSAHQSIIHLRADGRTFHMRNIHTSTAERNVQIVLWGDASKSHLIRGIALDLIRGGFRFLGEVAPFVERERLRLDDESLPVEVSTLPTGWRPAYKGDLNEEAVIELEHPEGGLFLIGIFEAGEVPFAAMEEALQDNVGGVLKDPDGATPAPFDLEGEAGDLSWSQAGRLGDEELDVTYRVRLVHEGGRYLHLYCWGQSGRAGRRAACEGALQAVSLKR